MNFYPIPETIIARDWHQVPQSRRCVGELSDWTLNVHGTFNDIFLEGPAVDQDGNLYVVDIPYGRILKIDKDGEKVESCVRWDGEPNGLALMPDGKLVVADYKQGIMLFDPANNTITPHLTRRNLERFKGPNDLIVDSQGNIFFTDQGQTGLQDPTGKVYRLSPSGKLDAIIENGISPNGLVMSLDERYLYVAMTRANQVWRCRLQQDGSVTKAGVFYQGFGNVGPDGLALDTEGNLFICDPGLGRVFVVDKNGVPLKSIRGENPEAFITNCTFGGLENKTLYLVSSLDGKILKVDWHCPGATRVKPW